MSKELIDKGCGPNMNGLSELLTILVPTYNRPKALRATLEFMSKSFDGTIIVIDSSTREALEENKKTTIACDRDTIDHKILPSDIDVSYKFELAANMVKTKYTLFCGDDDFIVPSAALDAVRILEEDETVRSVTGRALHLHLNKSKSLSITNYRQRSCEKDGWIERLEDYVRPYSTTFYSVQTAIDIKSTIEAMQKYGIRDRFAELFAAFANVTRGKVNRMDRLFLVRGSNEPNRASSQSQKFWSYLFNPEFSEGVSSFLDGTLKYAETVNGAATDEAENAVKKIISDLLALNYFCDPKEAHQIAKQVDEGPDQLQWMERFNDQTNADTLILRDIVDGYLSIYQ